ncbi:MAG: hypothetical protein AAGF11_03620 [Myxococcota bacterium]
MKPEWESLLSLRDEIGDLFERAKDPSEGQPEVDYAVIKDKLFDEYHSLVDADALRSLIVKAVSIYEHTAPRASMEVAGALCRLSVEWWIINAILDHKCTGNVSSSDCRQVLLENAMMFWDEAYMPSLEEGIHPLQRGFYATASLCWARGQCSTFWVQMIASELLRYIFSRNIGVLGRVDTFDSVHDAMRARCEDGGMIAQTLLTELESGPIELSETTRRSATYTEALERLSTLTALINDVASIWIDQRSGALNVALFLYEQNCPPMDRDEAMLAALRETCELLRHEYMLLVAALAEIESLGTDEPHVLRSYTDYLRTFCRRYWNWQMSCRPYFSPGHPVVELRRVGMPGQLPKHRMG